MLGKRRGKKINEYVSDYVVFDLETTGISPYNDSIIEISAVKVVDGNIVGEFSELVNPLRPIPPQASAVNNITDDMVCDCPTIDEIMPKFIEFAGDFVLVGHNIHCFDMKYMWRICEELYNETLANDYLDTLPFARKRLPKLAHHRLVDIASHYGITTEGAHRALNDCIMNQKCFELLAREVEQANETGKAQKICPKCGEELRLRNGIYGEFYGCSGFPNCRYTENVSR